MPDALIEAGIAARQPMRAFNERHILLVPYFEWALYQWDDEQRTPEAITALAREVEQRSSASAAARARRWRSRTCCR